VLKKGAVIMTGDYYKIDPKVIIGVPTLQKAPVSWQWSDAFYALQFPLGSSSARLRIHDTIVAEARNQLCQQAININADWLLFISDDVIAPNNAFDLLSRHKEPLVTGVYWTKAQSCRKPYIWRGMMRGPFENWKYGEYFEIDWAGCDCLLINVNDVLRKIDPPWFSHDWRWTEATERPATLATEDLFFYTKCKKAGIKLWCDTGVQCWHIDRDTQMGFGLDSTMPQHLNYKACVPPVKGKKYIADIGAGNWSPYFGDEVVVKRFDINPEVKPDVVCDVRAIPERDETFDMVYSAHVLEHFNYFEVRNVVKEWIRILKVNGDLRIMVPNLEWAAREVLKTCDNPNYDASYAFGSIYGYRTDVKVHSPRSRQHHRIGFTKHGLQTLLELEKCLSEIKVTAEGFDADASLTATAKKISPSKAYVVIKDWNEIAEREGEVLKDDELGSVRIETIDKTIPKPESEKGRN